MKQKYEAEIYKTLNTWVKLIMTNIKLIKIIIVLKDNEWK